MSIPFRRRKGPATYEADGYSAQCMYNGESCIVIGSTVAPGASGPASHMHEYSDQLYFVTEGEMGMRLESEEFSLGPETLVYIPKDTPHCNWSLGASEEFHFEVLSPTPFVTQPIATPTDSREGPGGYVVRAASEVEQEEPLPGFRVQRMLAASDDSAQMTLNLIESDPGSGGPSMHLHAFDQLFYILDGAMTVEVALQTFVATPGDLVVLPAGVPHTQRNDGAGPERHLALLTPSPLPDEKWDIGVTLETTGVDH